MRALWLLLLLGLLCASYVRGQEEAEEDYEDDQYEDEEEEEDVEDGDENEEDEEEEDEAPPVHVEPVVQTHVEPVHTPKYQDHADKRVVSFEFRLRRPEPVTVKNFSLDSDCYLTIRFPVDPT